MLWSSALLLLAAISSAAGQSHTRASEPTVIPDRPVELSVWYLPLPESTDIRALGDRAVVRAFREKYPYIKLRSPTGISIPELGMDSRPLMAIAGGVSPDVIYVNFRQSDTYIQEGFLYPLDEWFDKLPADEQQERLLPQVKKVVYRWGPGKKTGLDARKHYWALPYGNYIKGLVWRKDLFQMVGLDPERPPQNWDELYEFAKRCTDPARGSYGLLWGRGEHWSWHFYSLICSAGARAMEDRGEDEWVACFNSPEAVDAYEMILGLAEGKWRHPSGKVIEGMVCRDLDGYLLWEQGRIGMKEMYFSEEFLVDINPELVGMAPVPVGPRGQRGSELNCTMCGIFTGAAKKGRDVLEAAWKYVHFFGSPEAKAIRTKVLVENGYGMFANPAYLEKLGYFEYVRRIPKTWRDTFQTAMSDGEPEPYGRNCQMVYAYMSWPADAMLQKGLARKTFEAAESARKRLKERQPDISEEALAAELAKVEEAARAEVRAEIKALLDGYVREANEKMIGRVPEPEMNKRRAVALAIAVVIVVSFTALFVYIFRVFTPPEARSKGRWQFRRYWFAYLLLIPAVASILVWQYVPLGWGALMAFQDYHIVLPTTWIGLDNFASVLWDSEFWQGMVASLWYAFLAISMGFFAPIILAILLHEVPKGKILYRTLYYLPAVISGLVVMLMWKSFFDPSPQGLLNQVITGIPPWGWYLAGGAATAGLALAAYYNRREGRTVAAAVLAVLAALAGGGTLALWLYESVPFHHQKWLDDSRWAMPCVILPTVWAGIGPGCLIYLAALKTIPEDLYEAADLDGAGFLGKTWHITIPSIRVLIAINFIGAVIGAFRVAEYILAMTGGGPAKATQVLALKIFYDAFVYLRFGFATATAWVLGGMLIGFTVFQLKRLSRVEFRTAGR
jgi:multiple sugar transport system permease protein